MTTDTLCQSDLLVFYFSTGKLETCFQSKLLCLDVGHQTNTQDVFIYLYPSESLQIRSNRSDCEDERWSVLYFCNRYWK